MNNLHGYLGYSLNPYWTLNAGVTLADYSFEDPGRINDPASRAFLGEISRGMATFSIKNKYENTIGGIYGFYNWGTHSFSDGWKSDDINAGINIYQGYKLTEDLTITAGFDAKQYGGIGSFGFLADTFLRVNELAGYLLAEYDVGSWLSLTAGGRYEHHSVFGSEIVPQVGLTLDPVSGTTVKGLVSKGFRSPTIMEMYLFAPNAELLPEQLWNYEVSISQRLGWVGIAHLTAYTMSGSNLIIVAPNPNPGPPMMRQNGGDISNWGIELESSFMPIENLKLDVNYSYLNSNTKLYYAPKNQLFVSALYRVGKISAGLQAKAVQDLYTTIDPSDANMDQLESYFLLDAKIRYEITDFMEFYMAGKNLLNTDYQTVNGYPMPGTAIIGGVRFII